MNLFHYYAAHITTEKDRIWDCYWVNSLGQLAEDGKRWTCFPDLKTFSTEYQYRGPSAYRRCSSIREHEDEITRARRKREFALRRPKGSKENSARRRLRYPKWRDKGKINYIYAQSQKQSGMCVDHTIPLQGKLVSGLHVHNNLQVMTVCENASKYNKYEP